MYIILLIIRITCFNLIESLELMHGIYSVYQNYCDSSLKDHGHYNFKARQLIFNGLVAYPFLPMLLKNGLDWPSFDQVTSVLVQVVQF